MTTTHLKIEGMQCDACVSHVEKALKAVPGVQNVQVDLQNGRALVQHEGGDENAIKQAVDEEGYQAQPISADA